MGKGEISLTAIVLALLGFVVADAVYHNPRLGLAIVAGIAAMTIAYTLLGGGGNSKGGSGGGGGTPPPNSGA